MKNLNFLKVIFFVGIIALTHSCTDETTLVDRDKYVGTWTCKEVQTGLPGSTTFTIRMEALGTDDSLSVYNFNNLGQNTRAIFIVNGNSVVIPAQSITGFNISGSGTLSSNKLSLSYDVDADSYTAECNK